MVVDSPVQKRIDANDEIVSSQYSSLSSIKSPHATVALEREALVEEERETTAVTPASEMASYLPGTNGLSQDDPSRFSKFIRRLRVFLLAGRVFLSYKYVKIRDRKIRRDLGLTDDNDDGDHHPELNKLWNEAHKKNAKRILRGIESLQGFWIKVGQYLSSRADVMPKPYLDILSSLQDGVPAKPFADVEKTLSEQFSQATINDLFAEIDPYPLSTASLAQVHRAKLKRDGRDVVIKAQHRGVASLMFQDMENLRTILRLLAKSEPNMDYNPVVNEYTKEVRKELDFRIEAANMREVKARLIEKQVRAVIPEVVSDLVTEKILVMEFCEGFPIRDVAKLDKYNVDRQLLLERVCTSWAEQMHRLGVFNADPHSGNILVSTNQEDGDASVPILLDFGLTKRFDDHMKVAFSRLVHAAHDTDVDGLLEAFSEMGLRLNRYDPFQDMHAMQTAFADTTPQSEAADAKKKRAKEWKERQEAMREDQGIEKGQKLRNPVDAWPSELIFFTRVTAMLRGLCSRLDVRYPYLASMAEAASKTLRESVPEHEHAAGTIYESPDTLIDTKLQKRLRDLALDLIEEDHATGMQVCVLHLGKTVANLAAGTLGTVNPRPVTPRSLFNVFSVSKAVLASGTLRLLEEKGISVDEPIAKYWPEFGASHPEKQKISIRHAMSHQSGLSNVFPPNASIETLTDWHHMKEFIAGPDAIPSHPPEAETHYHYLSYAWILGGFIEAVTGEPYEKFLLEHLLEPLDLKDELHMGGLPDEVAREELAVLTARTLRETGVPDGSDTEKRRVADEAKKSSDSTETRSRLAKYQGREQLMNPSVFNMRKVRAAKIPSANGHASAFALAKLMNAVSNGTLLSPSTMEDAGTPQQVSSKIDSSAMLDNSMALFGLGFQIHEFKHKDGSTVRSVGHAGFGGSIVLAIPQLELAIAFTTNQLKFKSVARTRVLQTVLDEMGLEMPPSLSDS